MSTAFRSKGSLAVTALALLAGAIALLLVAGPGPQAAEASSHREAPLIATDPTADNTDLYAFVSPDRPDTVTFVANYVPFEEPAGGPNFFNFDPSALYTPPPGHTVHYLDRVGIPGVAFDTCPQELTSE